MPALTPEQLADPRVRKLIAAAFRTARSLSPALEGDLAAFCGPLFCPPADFARAVERVGEVEQRGAAAAFTFSDQFLGPNSMGFAVQFRAAPGGGFYEVPGVITPAQLAAIRFHAPKLRAAVVPRQCDASRVLHPENVQ